MAKFNKLVGVAAAAALLTTLAPIGATAVQVDSTAKVEKKAPYATDQILVKAKPGKDLKAIAKKHGAGNVEDLSSLVTTKVVKVPAGKVEEFVEKFSKDGDVEYAEPDYVLENFMTPNDPSYGSQYHLTKIQANLAWDIVGTDKPAVPVAVVDTGVDIQHPDLSGKIVAGYDFVNNDDNADDDHGHGTHVAGIIAATINNGLNGAGVSYSARIMPLKVLNAQGSGMTSNMIKSIDFARLNGARVVNMSFGGGTYSQAFQDVINVAWYSGNMILVAAAGNAGNTTPTYPANYDNVIAVASTTSTDAKSSFSTYGTWVDIAAPGSSIYSTANGGGMTTMSGTSMSAPVVSGVAAILISMNPTAPNTLIRDRLLNSADKITGTGSYWYAGRVNAYKAVNGF